MGNKASSSISSSARRVHAFRGFDVVKQSAAGLESGCTGYYKIMTKDQCHRGFQFKDGLNILPDNEVFAEKGDCVPGGFYFTNTQNIWQYIEIGPYVREVMLPHYNPNFKMRSLRGINVHALPLKYRANMIYLSKMWTIADPSILELPVGKYLTIMDCFLSALAHEDTANMRKIIPSLMVTLHQPPTYRIEERLWEYHKKGWNMESCIRSSIRLAIREKDMILLRMMIQNYDPIPHFPYIQALYAAMNANDLDLVKVFFERNLVKAEHIGQTAMEYICLQGHERILRYLVEEQGLNIAENHHQAIVCAAKNGHWTLVRYLIEECGANSHACHGAPLMYAQKHKNEEMIAYLTAHQVSA